MTDQFIAGIIGAPFGLKGFVKVKPFSGETEHLLKLKSVMLRREGKEQVHDIEESAATGAGDVLVIRFAGFNSPEEAGTLRGAELVVNRENAAPLRQDEYYVEDLKGLAVIAKSGMTAGGAPSAGEILGHITGVIEGGGGDIAEIRLKNGSVRPVPLINEFFTEIDLEKGVITLKNLWVLE